MPRMSKVLQQLSFITGEKPIVYFVTEDDDFLDELFIKRDEFNFWEQKDLIPQMVPRKSLQQEKRKLINGLLNINETWGWKPFEKWTEKTTKDEITKNVYFYKNANAKLNSADIKGMQTFYLSCSSYINLFKQIEKNERKNAMLLLSGSSYVLPKGLESYVEVIEVEYEDEGDIKERLYDRLFNTEIKSDSNLSNDIDKIAHELKGFNFSQIEYVINMIEMHNPNSRQMNSAVIKNKIGQIKATVKEASNHIKEQMVMKNGILRFIEIDEKKEYSLSGFEEMDDWIDSVSNLFLHPHLFPGAKPPRGVLIAGIPGTGKSQMAKRMSQKMNIPLLQLDIGSVLGGIVGESEENFRRALKLVESTSPCILFIDELDKAFPTGNAANTNEVTKHLFGKMLNWMQECNKNVFIYATANHINDLDSAFLRSGRFSGKYYTLMPLKEQLCDIIVNRLKEIRKKDDNFKWTERGDLNNQVADLLDKAAEKEMFFTGADIDEWINQAAIKLYNLYPKESIDNKKLYGVLKSELEKISPYGKTNMPEVVGYWLQWIFSQFNNCGNDVLFKPEIFDLENGNPTSKTKNEKLTFFTKEPTFNNVYDRLLFKKIRESIDRKGYSQIKSEFIDSAIRN